VRKKRKKEETTVAKYNGLPYWMAITRTAQQQNRMNMPSNYIPTSGIFFVT